MDFPEKLRRDIIHKIKGHQNETELSSSDSDTENSTATSLSIASESSSLLASPRANLLWDHGYDVAEVVNDTSTAEHREQEWKKFNITDDDKINADRRVSKRIDNRLKVKEVEPPDDFSTRKTSTFEHSQSHLPDLLAFTSSAVMTDSPTNEQVGISEEMAPPLPDSEPPEICENDTPPPLPSTSPPPLSPTHQDEEQPAESRHDMTQTDVQASYQTQICKDTAKSRNGSISKNIEGLFKELLFFDTQTGVESSNGSSLGNGVTRETDTSVINKTIENKSNKSASSDEDECEKNDFEEEFEAILHAFDLNFGQDTYVERFAGRRDKYGFLLSPIVEAPSPTPSSLSGYSGISSASPDPFSVFRMSPAPRGGNRMDMDLSSLGVLAGDFEENDQTVPIYQTVQARKAIVIPEGYGWESGDDLLSPNGTGEWDLYENGLSSPPVSASAINLSQFGTHVVGWKQPQAIILEEPEVDDDSDSTVSIESNSSGHHSDSTVEGEESANNYVRHDQDSHGHNQVISDRNVKAECSDASMRGESSESVRVLESMKLNQKLVSNCSPSKSELKRIESQQSIDSNSSSDITDGEDAEDEYSESENEENEENKEHGNCIVDLQNQFADVSVDRNVQVTELLSPKTAILLSGGMFPEDSDSSYETDDDKEDELECGSNMSGYGSGVLVTQYSSCDSDGGSSKTTEDMPKEVQPDYKDHDMKGKHAIDDHRNKHRVKIHSPLDFSLITPTFSLTSEIVSPFENQSPRTDDKRSPRVFGRYYTELEKEIIEEASTRNEQVETNASVDDHRNVSNECFFNTLSPEEKAWNDIAESFTNIEIKTIGNKEQFHHNAQQMTENITEQNVMNENEMNKTRKEAEGTDWKHTSKEASIYTARPENESENKSERNNAVTDTFNSTSTQRPDKRLLEKQNKSKKTSPVKISISHLSRKGSFSEKVKRGYVHQLSELFQQREEDVNKHEVVQKGILKKKKDPVQISKSPQMLLPKENVIIANRDSPVKTIDSLHNTLSPANESLGFEVTSFKQVDSFDDKTSEIADGSFISGDMYEDDFESDTSGVMPQDDGLFLYEAMLKQIDNETQELTHKETEQMAVDFHFDLKQSDSENEISEEIEGCVESDSSDDEELFLKIHACDPLIMSQNNSEDKERAGQPSDSGKVQTLIHRPVSMLNQTMRKTNNGIYVTNTNETQPHHAQTQLFTKDKLSTKYKQPQSQKHFDIEVAEITEPDKAEQRKTRTFDERIATKGASKVQGTNTNNATKHKARHDSARSHVDLGNIFWSSKLAQFRGSAFETKLKDSPGCKTACSDSDKSDGSLYDIFARIDHTPELKQGLTEEADKPTSNIFVRSEDAVSSPENQTKLNERYVSNMSTSARDSTERAKLVKNKEIRGSYDHFVSHANTSKHLEMVLSLTPPRNVVVIENEDENMPPYSPTDMKAPSSQPRTHPVPCRKRKLQEQPVETVINESVIVPPRSCEYKKKRSFDETRVSDVTNGFGTHITHSIPCIRERSSVTTLKTGKHVENDHVRYPPSLSKPLYGSHCRLNNIGPYSQARETTPPVLSPQREAKVLPSPLKGRMRVSQTSERSEPHTLPKRKKDQVKLQSKPELTDEYRVFEYAEGDLRNCYFLNKQAFDYREAKGSLDDLEYDIAGQSIDNIDGRIIYPGAFEHSYYDVKTPVFSTAQCEGIKPRSSPITYCNIAEAQHESPSEVLFSNSNQPSFSSPEAVNDDARKDKHQFGFLKPPHCNYTDSNVNTQNNSVSCDYADEQASLHAGNSEGGFTAKTAVKNDFFHENLGVCMPRETTFTESSHQNGNMKNDMQSNETKLSNASAVSPGINGFSSGQTASICQPHMSKGDVFTYDDKDGDRNSLRACRSETTTTVLIQTQDCQHVLEDEKGNLKVWPYSDFESSRRLPVTLHRATKGIKLVVRRAGMSHAASNMTVIQSAQHSTEMPENRITEKYHSSSVLPGDSGVVSLMQTHGESVQNVLFKDANGNTLTEEEFSVILPKIAESISKMKDVNTEEILPGITQSVSKLQNGGNLVITTMTRKLDEMESDESGRGSPEPPHPVLNVDDLENSKIYLVQDSKGELFYVEDITSESQESAYFSSRNTSEGTSDGGSSPNFQGISKILQVGNSDIQNSTAEEIISAMYDQNNVQEITENEEEWSERTYEYDMPRVRTVNPSQKYSKETFNSSYMVEEPDTLPRGKNVSQNRLASSYEVSGVMPWIYDGGISQSYSQATHGVDDVDSASVVSGGAGGLTRTSERLTVEAETEIYPLMPVTAMPPVPVFVPPLAVQTDTPQYSLVKVDVAPKKEELVSTKVDVTQKSKVVEVDDKPIYKTVAHIQTREKQPSVKSEMAEPKTYRIISSKASSADQEEQETRMNLNEVDYKYTAENVEYKISPSVQTTQYYVRNTTDLDSPKRYRTEKKLEINSSSDQKHRTEIQVQDTRDKMVEENSFYSYDEMKSRMEQTDSSMRVVRGSYLIKNNLDEVDESLDDNLNMFDGKFTLRKDNPLYQSDEDLYRRYEREKQELAQKQDHFNRSVNQDISFETVDRFTKSKAVKREERPKQSLSELLLSRLSTVDSKDIRQRIDVKHHSEDIYGDPRFIHADGSSSAQTSYGSSDFDSVGEKVDLLLKDGKAFITVKVTAERIVPLDMEFNVWRKNQAIVSRIIEVDLLATEQRRRLYYKVMEEPVGGSHGSYRAGPNETILDSKQTLELFTKILGAADGEGDKEDITVRTRSGRTTRPFTSGMDLMY